MALLPNLTSGEIDLQELKGREAFLRLAKQPADQLFERANQLRQKAAGQTISLCAIINIRSGNCSMDCKFCSQSSASRAQIPTWGMLDDASLERSIRKLAAGPYAHIGLVASGAFLSPRDIERLARLLERLEPAVRQRICASLGRLPQKDLRTLKNAGLVRYHHNLETSAAFYPRICTSQSWHERRATVLRAREAGLEICCGALFGLGESWGDRIDLALELDALGIRNVPLNFLHPQPHTPFGSRPPLGAEEALRVIAVYRHILPRARLRVCGGRPLCLGPRQDEIFAAGANALMSGDYLTTSGMALDVDLAMLAGLGLKPL